MNKFLFMFIRAEEVSTAIGGVAQRLIANGVSFEVETRPNGDAFVHLLCNTREDFRKTLKRLSRSVL